jgi:hypothetical protein
MRITTLNEIRKHRPCESGWTKLLSHLGKTKADDEPLPLLTILESNSLDDVLWCLRVLGPEHAGSVRLLACDFAETALKYTTDPRPAQAVEVARRYARNEATDEELVAAGAAEAAAMVEQERIFRAWLSKGEK